jgi:hypothetical protein
MKRHVWLPRGSYNLYPNIYVILVGRPSIGKGAAVRPAQRVMHEAGTVNMLSDRMSIEWQLTQISKGFPGQTTNAGGGIQVGIDNSNLIVAPELSTLLRSGSDPLGDLCALWDSTEQPFKYGTLSGSLKEVAKPCQSLFGGTTPRFISRYFPKTSSGEGFTRRVNFILETASGPPIYDEDNVPPVPVELLEDLRYIHGSMSGPFSVDPIAKPTFKRIRDESKAEDTDDEDTEGYRSSKWVHVVKYAIAIAAAESDDRILCKCHLEEADREIKKNLADIPTVFRSTGESSLAEAGDRIMRFVELKGYASRADMLHALWRHVSGPDLDILLATLTQGGTLGEIQKANKLLYYDPKSTVP